MTGMQRPIVLASGGTGGHIFPAQALSAELQARGYRLALIADRRADAYNGALGSIEAYRIQAAGLIGRSLSARISAVFRLTGGYFQARRHLKALRPLAVVGFGSYPSAPTMLAATHLKIKTVIHEQNAILGRANRMLASRATRIATAFRSVANMRETDRDKAVWTGNPVRPAVVAMRDRPYPELTPDGPINILIFGGSQGAQAFDEVVPAALAALSEELRRRLRVVQQCRPEGLETARATYQSADIAAETAPFFDDLPARIAAAHLMICRSGASTIAELAATGRPAIMVPFPHATDDHQKANAEGLCDAGGGWMIEQEMFTPVKLAERLSALLSLGPSLATAARCAARMGAPEAAGRLADLVVGVIEDNGDGALDDASEAAA